MEQKDMQWRSVVSVPALALLMAVEVGAQGAAPAAYQPCAACHGADAQGNPAMKAPALAGQEVAYLERQLGYFKSGIRGTDPRDSAGAQMKPMAIALSEQEVAALAAWLAESPVMAQVPSPDADLMNGNNYYQSKCGACHGGKAEGNSGLNAPALYMLDESYLKRQLGNFQQGIRGSHPDDRPGRQMKMMSTALPTEKDVEDVIAFIHAQGAAGESSGEAAE
ncbi:MAG: c-type cytochrome [Halioglobus sp.]